VEVELDPVSFQSTCRGVWMVIDMGEVWSRPTIIGVLEGEILRCLGATRLPGYAAASSEEGTVCSATDLIAAATQLPEIHIRLAETREAAMMGFEALPHLAVPAAYAAAICQATGLYIDKLPITPEAIQQCLET
jgi:CO/xanthine dehydrogenase Mo-binding subunit